MKWIPLSIFTYSLVSNSCLQSEDPLLGAPAVQNVMSSNCFDKLSKYLHLNNSANQVPHKNPAHDKLFKVQPVLDHVIQNCEI